MCNSSPPGICCFALYLVPLPGLSWTLISISMCMNDNKRHTRAHQKYNYSEHAATIIQRDELLSSFVFSILVIDRFNTLISFILGPL